MASVYPGALDTFATNKTNATATPTDHPNHHNDLADAVNKIEAELGIDPAGAAATVKARLDGISGGDVVYAAAAAAGVSINNVADQTIWTTDIAGIAAGDILVIETWGRGNNATGGARTWVFTLDTDSAFDMEWSFNAGAVNQAWRMQARVVIDASNFAAWQLETILNQQGDGVLQGIPGFHYGYETTTSDLTGTVTVSLKGRTDSATGTQNVHPYGIVIRKISAT